MILLYLYSFLVDHSGLCWTLPLTPSLCGQDLAAVMPRGSDLLSCIVRCLSSETSRARRLEKFLKVFLSVGLCRKKKEFECLFENYWTEHNHLLMVESIASNIPVVNVCTRFERWLLMPELRNMIYLCFTVK